MNFEGKKKSTQNVDVSESGETKSHSDNYSNFNVSKTIENMKNQIESVANVKYDDDSEDSDQNIEDFFKQHSGFRNEIFPQKKKFKKPKFKKKKDSPLTKGRKKRSNSLHYGKKRKKKISKKYLMDNLHISGFKIEKVPGSLVEILSPHEVQELLQKCKVSRHIIHGNRTLKIVTMPDSELNHSISSPFNKNKVLVLKEKSLKWTEHPEQAFGVTKLFQQLSKEVNLNETTLYNYNIAPLQKVSYKQRGNTFDFCFFYPYYKNSDLGSFSLMNYGMFEHEFKKLFPSMIKSIEFLHKRNVAHLDIHPGNFLFSDDMKKLILIDMDCLSRGEKLKKHISYKPLFVPPEITKKKIEHDPKKCDIFSLGVTIISALSVHGLSYSKNFYENIEIEGLDYFERIFPFKYFSKELNIMLIAMLREDPSKRPTIEEIKLYDWVKNDTNIEMENEIMKKKFKKNVNEKNVFDYLIENKSVLLEDKDFMRMVIQRIGLNYVFDEIVVRMSKKYDFIIKALIDEEKGNSDMKIKELKKKIKEGEEMPIKVVEKKEVIKIKPEKKSFVRRVGGSMLWFGLGLAVGVAMSSMVDKVLKRKHITLNIKFF